jgi:hypothetical protein
MPTKFKSDSFTYEGRGVARKQTRIKNYIKAVSKEELFATLNSPSTKSKIKQKCKNELIRRGIKLQYISTETPELNLGGLK